MVTYPVTLQPDDNDTLLATFPDFPEATSFGKDREDALLHARDALATIIDAYIRDRQRLPTPSAFMDESVELNALMSAKVGLYNAMREARISKAELARRLKVFPPQVDRLLDLRHASGFEQVEVALQAVGRRLEVSVSVLPIDAIKLRRKQMLAKVARHAPGPIAAAAGFAERRPASTQGKQQSAKMPG